MRKTLLKCFPFTQIRAACFFCCVKIALGEFVGTIVIVSWDTCTSSVHVSLHLHSFHWYASKKIIMSVTKEAPDCCPRCCARCCTQYMRSAICGHSVNRSN